MLGFAWHCQCLLSDGLFKHPDPECFTEQNIITEHETVTNNLIQFIQAFTGSRRILKRSDVRQY